MTSMKLTDLLCKFLKLHGTRYVFGVTGGSILHPLHSAHKEKLNVLYTHHEQAASFAADAATRLIGKPQACFVTTGPAGTNAMTGLLESWQDSVPQIIVSGQARLSDLTSPDSVRQIGSQHTDIVSLVSPITNKVVQLTDIQTAAASILAALFASNQKGRRPGPIWIDIPLDLQWQEVTLTSSPENIYKEYLRKYDASLEVASGQDRLVVELCNLRSKVNKSARPLFVLGAGLKNSSYCKEVIKILQEKRLPVALTWGSLDLIPSYDPTNFGLLGVNGQRSANLAAHLSDLIIAVGSHLSDQITGREKTLFAPLAERFVLDIDPLEISHGSGFFNGIEIDLNRDGRLLFDALSSLDARGTSSDFGTSLKAINSYSLIESCLGSSELNSYQLYSFIFKSAPNDTIFVADGGGNTFFGSLQNAEIKLGQKFITSTKTGCMGSGLPQAIGAACAFSEQKVICFIGDGSLQFNIQELQTIVSNQLNISIIVINNHGYQAIKDTQSSFFEDYYFGVDVSSGLDFPNIAKICEAYRLSHRCIHSLTDLNDESKHVIFESDSPVLIEVMIPENIPLLPALGKEKKVMKGSVMSSTANMYPYLPDSILNTLEGYELW